MPDNRPGTSLVRNSLANTLAPAAVPDAKQLLIDLENQFGSGYPAGETEWEELLGAKLRSTLSREQSRVRSRKALLGLAADRAHLLVGNAEVYYRWEGVSGPSGSGSSESKTVRTERTAAIVKQLWYNYHRSLISATGYEARIADYFVERDLLVIHAGDKPNSSGQNTERLTYQSMRRTSRNVILLMSLTQLIYVLTGAQLVHPFVAGLSIFLASVFYAMSLSMGKEIAAVIHERNYQTPTRLTRAT